MNSSKIFASVISTFALALLTSVNAEANLVTNPLFLSYTGLAPKNQIQQVSPTDWAGASFTYVDSPGSADNPLANGIPVYPPFPVNSPAGGNFIQADGTPGLSVAITQTINSLTALQNYTLTFYQAGDQELNGNVGSLENWEVSLGSDTQYSSVMNVPQGAVVPWQPQTLSFMATSTSEVLSFFAIGTPGDPPMVFFSDPDLEASVPEPSAFLLLAGVGMVIAIGRVGRRLLAKRMPAVV
jgi:PEP-CTERM motif